MESAEALIQGAMVSDKAGEVKFINIANLAKKVETEEERDSQGKVMFGHQQECLGMILTEDKKTLVSCDTLNRIRISDFPNVFNIRQIILEHKK